MSKVIITNSYFYRLDAKQWKSQQPYPPLGTLQAAAVTREAGFETIFHDASLVSEPEKIERTLDTHKPDYFIIYEDGFNYLTKMCLTVMRDAAFRMASLAKERGIVVIINSSDATDHYEKYFSHGVDFVIRGEGEETLKELLIALDSKNSFSSISGLAYLENGRPMLTQPRPVLRDLDSLPLPAWDLVDLKSYRQIWEPRHGFFSLNIATTRGCPYKCNWCAKPIYGNRYNSRSPGHVIDEIELLTRSGARHFWMSDDIFGLKPNWVKEFNELVKQRNLRLRYKIQSRADLLVEPGLVRALAESGCETVWLGAESGSQKILDAMDKGITLSEIREATTLLKTHGIKVGFFLQFGYPGETAEDVDQTINMVLDHMPEEIGISVSYPLPGTKFYENVRSQLKEKHNWTDSDDLAMMYKSTYPGVYYKILQRYVHSRYRITRGLNRLKEFSSKPGFKVGDVRKILSMIYNIPVSLVHSYRLRRLEGSHV